MTINIHSVVLSIVERLSSFKCYMTINMHSVVLSFVERFFSLATMMYVTVVY